jgi:hypothetical protein
LRRTGRGMAGFIGAAAVTLLLAGCGKDQANLSAGVADLTPTESASVAATVTPTPEPEPEASIAPSVDATPEPTPTPEALSEIDAYWKDFAPKIMYKQELYQEFEEKPIDYYIKGLSNTDPLIRWYCAYKVTDYADQLTKRIGKRCLRC